MTGLQALFETGELVVARGLEEGAELIQELREMRVRVSLGGHESFEAWRNGTPMTTWRRAAGAGMLEGLPRLGAAAR